MAIRQCDQCQTRMSPYVPRRQKDGEMLCGACYDRPRGGYISAEATAPDWRRAYDIGGATYNKLADHLFTPIEHGGHGFGDGHAMHREDGVVSDLPTGHPKYEPFGYEDISEMHRDGHQMADDPQKAAEELGIEPEHLSLPKHIHGSKRQAGIADWDPRKDCFCGQPGHSAAEHTEWAEARHAEGTHDAWGTPLMKAYDGHGAWNCNNYHCAEHPQKMYDEDLKAGQAPGWLVHDTDPNKALTREVNKAFHDTGQHDDARWLMDQQHQGPSKFSSRDQMNCPHDGGWNLHGQCKKCGYLPPTEGDEPCDNEWCVANEPEHTKAEHIDPPHLDPHHPDHRSAEQNVEDAIGDHPDAWLFDHNDQGPTKFSRKTASWSQARHPEPIVHVIGRRPPRPLQTGDTLMHPETGYSTPITAHSESLIQADGGIHHRGPMEGDFSNTIFGETADDRADMEKKLDVGSSDEQEFLKGNEQGPSKFSRKHASDDHEVLYHITDRHDFHPDPEKAPQDNAFAIQDRSHYRGLYVTDDPDRWRANDYHRPYVAEIHVPHGLARQERWHGEKFIPAEHFDKVKVNRVVPFDQHQRERWGGEGTIEEYHGTPASTGDKDARDFTPEEHTEHLQRMREYLHGVQGYGWNEFNDAHEHVGTDEHDDEGMPVRRDRNGNVMTRGRYAKKTASGLGDAMKGVIDHMTQEHGLDPARMGQMMRETQGSTPPLPAENVPSLRDDPEGVTNHVNSMVAWHDAMHTLHKDVLHHGDYMQKPTSPDAFTHVHAPTDELTHPKGGYEGFTEDDGTKRMYDPHHNEYSDNTPVVRGNDSPYAYKNEVSPNRWSRHRTDRYPNLRSFNNGEDHDTPEMAERGEVGNLGTCSETHKKPDHTVDEDGHARFWGDEDKGIEPDKCGECGAFKWLHAEHKPSEVGKPTDMENKRRMDEFGDRVKQTAPLTPLPHSLNHKKTARQLEIEMKYAPVARLTHRSGIQVVAHDSGDGETIYHCPFCGSGQVLARSDGTVECEFCHTAFTVQVQPEMSAFPQTINGVPVDVPGMPGEIGAEAPMNPVDLDPGAETGAPGEGGAPPAPGDESDQDDVENDVSEEDNDSKPPFLSSLRTESGAELPLNDYLKHVAIKHAADRAATIAMIRSRS